MLSTQRWLFDIDVQNLSQGQFVFCVLTLLLSSVLLVLCVFYFLKRARIIEDTPTSKIRSAAQGYVELNGRSQLMEGEKIYSPFSRKSCAWYRYKVERIGDRHGSSRISVIDSRVIESGVSDNLFLLVDSTGKCVIDAEGASITPKIKEKWYSSSYPCSVSKVNKGILAQIGAHYRLTEERLHPGENLYAIGHFHTVGGAQDSNNPRADMAVLLREWKKDKATLLARFDSNKDGDIDMQEWQKVQAAAAKEIHKNRQERMSSPGVNMLSAPPRSRKPFLISALDPKQLSRRYRLFSFASFASFLGSVGLSVWLWGLR